MLLLSYIVADTLGSDGGREVGLAEYVRTIMGWDERLVRVLVLSARR